MAEAAVAEEGGAAAGRRDSWGGLPWERGSERRSTFEMVWGVIMEEEDEEEEVLVRCFLKFLIALLLVNNNNGLLIIASSNLYNFF